MKQKIIIDTIKLDGKIKNVYLCDRKADCKNSIHCGKECTCTFDETHAAYANIDVQQN